MPKRKREDAQTAAAGAKNASAAPDEEDEISVDPRRDQEGMHGDDSGPESHADEGPQHNLPALSTGFVARGLSFRDRGSDSEYSGGSDDEDEDLDVDIDENAEENVAVGADGKRKSAGKQKARKNRMGQRARQALWEKKYGRNARHIAILKREPRVKQPGYEGAARGRGPPQRGGRGGHRAPSGRGTGAALDLPPVAAKRDQGWATARGQALAPQPARGGPAPRRWKDTPSATSAAGPTAATSRAALRGAAPAKAPATSSNSANATPHPSWLAKQRQKEQLKQALTLKPTGKKVVFD